MSAPSAGRLGWYARRLARMSPGEVAWRARDQAVQLAWSRRQVTRGRIAAGVSPPAGERRFAAVLPEGTAALVPDAARKAVLAAADQLMRGEWEVLGVTRADLVAPDWFFDPVTRRRSDPDRYAFRIDHRSEEQAGNVKQVWEISRLQHLTLLASAWFVSHDDAYAQRVADQLRSWWRENPFLSGIHWTSGIEIGIRLISMAWIRRLLDEWGPVADLFERNDLAVQQIRWHQQYLAAFRSRGSSANNHVIAEAAGQLVASCAFPWFPESGRWREQSARLLEAELAHNTFSSGINRELASDYHCFVAEPGLLGLVEAEASGHPLSAATGRLLCAMVDSAAALLDERLQPPRQGDGDEGRGLLLDAPVANRWPSLLAAGEALFGRLVWWPVTGADVNSVVMGALMPSARDIADRPAERPWHFADAGITLLRTAPEQGPEIWCRCDGGPHGFLSIAAHAHADALSVEVRYGGVEILADPGTYCYHGEPEWRSYFRSTIAHNTVEVDGQNQSSEGGPFLWLRHASAHVADVRDDGEITSWTAEHDGYSALSPGLRHRRTVLLSRAGGSIEILDEITGKHDVRLAFHFGSEVYVELSESCASLCWAGTAGRETARLDLPPALRWSLHRGETHPVLGWHSSGLGHRVPAFTLIGLGRSVPGRAFTTRLEFAGTGAANTPDGKQAGVSGSGGDALLKVTPGLGAEAG